MKPTESRGQTFLLGLLTGLLILLLMGAAKRDTVVIDNGRYQVSAWGDADAHGAFVIDTVSGVTKIVYRYKETGGKAFKERNHLNKAFADIP